MKNYSEIKDQLDAGDPIAKEVFLSLLTNLYKTYYDEGYSMDVTAKTSKAKNMLTIEMRKQGFLGPTEYLFHENWLTLYHILVSHSMAVENEMVNILSYEIGAEINRQILAE